jgi:hypothetical protein
MVHRPNHASKTRDRDARLRNPLDGAGIRRPVQSVVLSFTIEIGTAELHENPSEILCRILLPAVETSLRALEVFYDCSGGNSRPSRLSGVGGGNFLAPNVRPFFLLVICSCLIASEQKRSTPNVQCRNQQTRIVLHGQSR